MTALFLVVLTTHENGDMVSPFPAPVYTHDLREMTWDQAKALDGKRVRVELVAEWADEDGTGAESSEGLFVFLPPAGDPPEDGTRLVVDCVHRSRHLPAKTSEGQVFPAVRCVDVLDVVPVK